MRVMTDRLDRLQRNQEALLANAHVSSPTSTPVPAILGNSTASQPEEFQAMTNKLDTLLNQIQSMQQMQKDLTNKVGRVESQIEKSGKEQISAIENVSKSAGVVPTSTASPRAPPTRQETSQQPPASKGPRSGGPGAPGPEPSTAMTSSTAVPVPTSSTKGVPLATGAVPVSTPPSGKGEKGKAQLNLMKGGPPVTAKGAVKPDSVAIGKPAVVKGATGPTAVKLEKVGEMTLPSKNSKSAGVKGGPPVPSVKN